MGDESPEVIYETRKVVQTDILVRYKFIYPAAADRYPPGACYALHYGVTAPADPPADVEWPVGPEQGTMLRYDNDGTHHRHVGGDLDPDYDFPGSVAAVYERFFQETGIDPFGPSPEDYDI
jgi:hypothetical protein